MAKAKLLLKNDVGLVLDITENPLDCTVYDLEGNQIGGGGGIDIQYVDLTIVNNTGSAQNPSFAYLNANGYFYTTLALAIGQTANVKVLLNYSSKNYGVMDLYDLDNITLTLSNAVNCTLIGIKLTKTAEGSSSATLTLS